MAVIAQWMCDRDNSMFNSKKEADAHDKMLELGEQFTALMLEKIPGMDEQQAEEFGIYLAENKDAIMQACKGNPEVLADLGNASGDNVTPISVQV
jgi:dsDNA-binding SOS-regulon protein|tara:strand:- start:1612 stop:1896 length:285 start_codon:yes stop_codon:yes gene_type:complete